MALPAPAFSSPASLHARLLTFSFASGFSGEGVPVEDGTGCLSFLSWFWFPQETDPETRIGIEVIS